MKTKKARLHARILRRVKGFTIIEVIIVLAIAGLIMVVVFLAVPALRRVQADNFRKDYAYKVMAAVIQFRTDHGSFPACDGTAHSTPAFDCSSDNDRQHAVDFLRDYLPAGADAATGVYTGPTIQSDEGTAWTSANNIYYKFDASRVNHYLEPGPGIMFIGAAHYCYATHPDGTNSVVTGDDLDLKRFYVLVGLTNGYYCIDTGK